MAATFARGEGPPLDLLKLFNEFDEDHSGQISYAEFFNVLEHLAGSKPCMEAVLAILQDIDMDGSGSIDFDEFAEFFSRLDDMDNLLTKTEHRSKFCQVCAFVIFGISLLTFFSILMLEATMHEDDFGTDYATVVRMMRNGSGVTLACSFLQSVLAPIFSMRLAACRRHLDSRGKRRAEQRKERNRLAKAQEKAKGKAGPPGGKGAWQSAPPAIRASAVNKPPSVSYRPSKRLESSGASWSPNVPPLPPDVFPPRYPDDPHPPNFYPEPLPPTEPPPPVTRPRLPLGIDGDPGVGYEASAYDVAAWRQEELAQAHAIAPPGHFNPLIHSGSMAPPGTFPIAPRVTMGSDVLGQRLALDHLEAGQYRY